MRTPWRGLAWLSLAALVLAVTAPGFRNRFVQDDLPLILTNPDIQTLDHPARFFATSYWHDPFPRALYRPLATVGLALQWRAGGGTPGVYRGVSAALLFLVTVAVFELALLLMPALPALAAAALFAVHPVHVEAIALGVNQGELAVGFLLVWATRCYLLARRSPGISPARGLAIGVIYLAAGLIKENGLMLPALLLAAELTVVTDPRGLRSRIGTLRPLYLGLGLVAALLLAARSAVLSGDLAGTFTADALAGSNWPERARTMLGVVPHWARLLLWPSHLQADYGPGEITRATVWGAAQWAGLVTLALWSAALAASWKRRPALAFGLLWIPLALLPVSNVLVPTGVTLAERTLFLGSVGIVLAAGSTLAMLRIRAPAALAAVVASLAVLGLLRSRGRAAVWADQGTLLRATVEDAPRSYAAHLALARFEEDSGSVARARAEYRQAVALRPELLIRERALADQFRQAGLCPAAIRRYRRLLAATPEDTTLQSALRACGDSALQDFPR